MLLPPCHEKVMLTNREIQVTVADTGIGISPEHLGDIFTRFYRVDKSRSRAAGGGSGIGLWHGRLVLQRLNATIMADNPKTGGARFVIRLPMTGSSPVSDTPV